MHKPGMVAEIDRADRAARADREDAARMRDAPASPRLEDHRLAGDRERVIGPRDPVLRRHMGQVPIAFVGRHRSLDADGARPPGLSRSVFELAVFEDGTLAVDGMACVGEAGLFIGRASPAELRALRTLAGEECLRLSGSDTWCSHGDRTEILCSADSRVVKVRDAGCEDKRENRMFIEEVVRVLGLEKRLVGGEACGRSSYDFSGPKIGVLDIRETIWPTRIHEKSYEPR